MCFCIQHLYALETKGLPQCVILTIDPFPVNETGTSNKRGCHKELQEVRNDIMSMGCYMPRMRDGRYIVGKMAQQGSRLRYQDSEPRYVQVYGGINPVQAYSRQYRMQTTLTLK